jgi:hypothetical protein
MMEGRMLMGLLGEERVLVSMKLCLKCASDTLAIDTLDCALFEKAICRSIPEVLRREQV